MYQNEVKGIFSGHRYCMKRRQKVPFCFKIILDSPIEHKKETKIPGDLTLNFILLPSVSKKVNQVLLEIDNVDQ